VEPDYRLAEGDIVRIFLSEEQMEEIAQKKVESEFAEKPNTRIDIKTLILYEDEDLLVINKPPYINVHPGDHKTNELSIIQLVQDYLGDAYSSASFRPSLVHRIDRDTS